MDISSLPIDIGAMNSSRLTDEAQQLAEKGQDAGEKMEALFATMLVKELRQALPNKGFFGEGQGADIFNGWMDEYLGEQLARDGVLDIAGRVKASFTNQEAQPEDKTDA